jgi:hypothetical protein
MAASTDETVLQSEGPGGTRVAPPTFPQVCVPNSGR